MSQDDKRKKYEILNLQSDLAAYERGIVGSCACLGLGMLGIAAVGMANPDIMKDLHPLSNYHDFMQYLYSIGPAGLYTGLSATAFAINSTRMEQCLSKIYNMLDSGLVTSDELRENDEKHGASRGIMGFLRKTLFKNNREYSMYDATNNEDVNQLDF